MGVGGFLVYKWLKARKNPEGDQEERDNDAIGSLKDTEE
jgi:hypothetical protein